MMEVFSMEGPMAATVKCVEPSSHHLGVLTIGSSIGACQMPPALIGELVKTIIKTHMLSTMT